MEETRYPLKFSSRYCIYVCYKEKQESSRDPLAPKIISESSVVNKSKCWPDFHTLKFSFYQESGFLVKLSDKHFQSANTANGHKTLRAVPLTPPLLPPIER